MQFFGGRGASGGDRPKGGGGGGNGNFSNSPMPSQYNPANNIKDAIGAKGRPFSIDNALKNVNPNHSYAYSEFSENCQRCVIAYELRRRGYDVTALATYQGDTLPLASMGGHGNGRWMGAFRGAKNEKVGGKTSKAVQSNLEAKMKGYGSGSRAVVRIPGHVFNAENVNGRIKYVDAQTGKHYTNKDVFGRLSKSELKGVRIVRTDNLRVSYRVKDAVKVVERKKR